MIRLFRLLKSALWHFIWVIFTLNIIGCDLGSSKNTPSSEIYYFLSCEGLEAQANVSVLLQRPNELESLYTAQLDIEDSAIISEGYECLIVASESANKFANVEYFSLVDDDIEVSETKHVVPASVHFLIYFPFPGSYSIQFDDSSLEFTVGAGELDTTVKTIKGLAVIADFSDRSLEDYNGDGLNSEAGLRQQLVEMEEHWSWLSRGKESISWDVLRIVLPKNFSEDAYNNWVSFRLAVVQELSKHVLLDHYDSDKDDDIDVLWVIPANGSSNPDYLAGGASWTSGAHVFVDAQNSRSLAEMRTGNFNHEVGHLRGLPDLYGPLSTIHNLSIMDSSWPLPAGDFTPYERTLLNWLEPYIAQIGTQRVVLANSVIEPVALKIPSIRENEFFLVEYRSTPESGYGSINAGVDGLAIYHVLEGANQSSGYPLISLVPADGVISPSDSLNSDDILSPDHPAASEPFTLKSYFGDEPLAQLSNLSQSDRGMQFDLTVFSQAGLSLNHLHNASAEIGDSSPEGWSTGGWRSSEGRYIWTSDLSLSGSRALELVADTPNDIQWQREISGLELGANYSACGYLKSDAVIGVEGIIGMNIGIAWTDNDGNLRNINRGAGVGSYDWKKVCAVFEAEQETQTIQCRLGAWAQTATGRGYCDDFYVEKIE